MSEAALEVLCEGPTDAALLEAMQGARLLPDRLKIGRPPPGAGGKDRLPRDAAALLAVGKRVLVVHDRDEHSATHLAAEIRGQVRGEITDLAEAESVPRTTNGFVACRGSSPALGIVTVGLEDIEALTGVTPLPRRTIDDYVLRIALDQASWQRRGELRSCEHSVFRKKVREVADLLRQNGLAAEGSKQLVTTIRLVTGFGASQAHLAAYLWHACLEAHGEGARAFAQPLADDIAVVVARLRATD